MLAFGRTQILHRWSWSWSRR